MEKQNAAYTLLAGDENLANYGFLSASQQIVIFLFSTGKLLALPA